MIRECFRTNTEIQFYREPLERLGLNPDALVELGQPASTPSSAGATKAEAAFHVAEPTDGTLVDPTEESEELKDVDTDIHDELKIKKAWWILELLPTRYREQIQKDDERYMWRHYWKYVFLHRTISESFTWVWHSRRSNLGQGRTVPKRVRDRKDKILVHRSVKTKMEKEPNYEPKVNFREFDHEFVD